MTTYMMPSRLWSTVTTQSWRRRHQAAERRLRLSGAAMVSDAALIGISLRLSAASAGSDELVEVARCESFIAGIRRPA